ncbi:hypothetical protein [Paenibacillus sp. 8b26]|uniref:hypothetical protein n=1 Tax=Paenibacillus sp. 8b26 TaxID=3424133 RepID=UPI003D65B99F
MRHKKKELGIGMAAVTGQGLKFAGLCYSSKILMKYQHFEDAQKNGEWKIPVLFFEKNLDILIIVNFDFVDLAYVIDKRVSVNEQVLDAYYEAIRNLRAQLKFAKQMLR